jgi:hypothetical protein
MKIEMKLLYDSIIELLGIDYREIKHTLIYPVSKSLQ